MNLGPLHKIFSIHADNMFFVTEHDGIMWAGCRYWMVNTHPRAAWWHEELGHYNLRLEPFRADVTRRGIIRIEETAPPIHGILVDPAASNNNYHLFPAMSDYGRLSAIVVPGEPEADAYVFRHLDNRAVLLDRGYFDVVQYLATVTDWWQSSTSRPAMGTTKEGVVSAALMPIRANLTGSFDNLDLSEALA